MQENGLISVHKAKFKATTNSNHNYPIAPNLLQKDFTALAPGQKWVGDITYIPTNEGWLYLAAIEDLYHRKVVGWALGARMTKQLTIDALDQALADRLPARCHLPVGQGLSICRLQCQDSLGKRDTTKYER